MPKFTKVSSRELKYLQNGALLGGAAGALGGYLLNDGTWKQRLKASLVGTLIGAGVGGTTGWGSAKILDLKNRLNKFNTPLANVTPKVEEAIFQAGNRIAALPSGTSAPVSDVAPKACAIGQAVAKGQGKGTEIAADVLPQVTSVTSFDPSFVNNVNNNDKSIVLPKYLKSKQPSPVNSALNSLLNPETDNRVTVDYDGHHLIVENDKLNNGIKPSTANSFVQQQFVAREKQLNHESARIKSELDNLNRNRPSVFQDAYAAEKTKHDTRVAGTERILDRVLSARILRNADGSFEKLYGPRSPNSPVLSFDSALQPNNETVFSNIARDISALGLNNTGIEHGLFPSDPYIRKADQVAERLVYDALPNSLKRNPNWNRFGNNLNTLGDVFTNAIPRYDNQGLAGDGTLISDRGNSKNEQFKKDYKEGVRQRYSNEGNYNFWGDEQVDPAQYIASLGGAMQPQDQAVIAYENAIFPKYRREGTRNEFKSDAARDAFNNEVAKYKAEHSIASTKKKELTKLLTALVSNKYNADKSVVDTTDKIQNQLPLFTPNKNFLDFHRLDPNSDGSAVQFTNGRIGTDMLSALTNELEPILSASDRAANKLSTDFDYAMGDSIVRRGPRENTNSFKDKLTSYENDYRDFITDAALSNPLYRRGILAKDLNELSTLKDRYSRSTNKDFTLIPAGMQDVAESDKEAITRNIKDGIAELYKAVGKQEKGGKQVVISLNPNLGTFGPMLVVNNLPNNVDENKIKTYFKNLSTFNFLTSN